MKKLLSVLLILASLAALCACGKKEETHTHTFSDILYGNKESHFYLCSCGERAEEVLHTFVDDYCEGCNGYFYVYEDNTSDFTLYNENEDWYFCIYYNEQGKIVSSSRAEYVYDENGNWKNVKTYEDDRLSMESNYEIGADGYPIEISGVHYFEDGEKLVYKNNSLGYMESQVYYDAKGVAISESTCEYVFDSEQNIKQISSYSNGALTCIDYYTLSEEGFSYLAKNVSYNEDGSTTVTEYNEDGEEIHVYTE